MRFSCDSCSAQYMISDEKVGPGGVKVRCKKCGHIILVKRAPTVAPTIEAAAAGAQAMMDGPAPRAPGENTLETELGTAFQNVFGGGSAAVSAERGAAMPSVAAAEPQPANTTANVAADAAASAFQGPAQNPVVSAEAFSDWYVAIDDDQVGPIAASGVKSRWESGEVGPDTLAWRPGMADWTAISNIPEMAQYLAPVARGSAKVAPSSGAAAAVASAPPAEASRANGAEEREEAEPRASQAAAFTAPTSAGGLNGVAKDAEWKPAAASALAALASEEMASLSRPAPKQAAAPAASGATAGGSSLLERMDLPDGGVDPTNVVPLPIKGLEHTGEAALRTKSPPPGDSTQIRELKKTTTRSVLYIGIAMVALFAVGIAVVAVMMRPAREGPRVATAPEAAPAPATSPPAAPAQAPAPAPNPPVAAAPSTSPSTSPPSSTSTSTSSPEGTSTAATPRTPEAAAAATTAPSAAAPATAPPHEPERVAAAPQREPPPRTEPPRRSRPEPSQRLAEKPKRPPRLAHAEPPPQPPPVQAPPQQAAPTPPPARPAPAADPDDEIDKILSGSGGSAAAAAPAANGAGAARKRSVYVPPAIGSDLPENVTVSQINEAVLGQKPALMRCIEQQKAADPDTRGTLKLRWLIAGDGGVRDVRVLSDEFSRQPIAGCITGVVRGLHFPRSRTTGQEVVFPFKF